MSIHIVTDRTLDLEDYKLQRGQAEILQIARWQAEKEEKERLIIENARYLLKSKISEKHAAMTIWRVPVIVKKIDRIKAHMAFFLIYTGCAALVALGLSGVVWAWRFFFWGAVGVLN